MPRPNANAYRMVADRSTLKKVHTCPYCGTATYITKDGCWHKHRQPPGSNYDFNIPLVAGPVCPMSGRTAIIRPTRWSD